MLPAQCIDSDFDDFEGRGRRYRPGTKALQEIRQYQRVTNNQSAVISIELSGYQNYWEKERNVKTEKKRKSD